MQQINFKLCGGYLPSKEFEESAGYDLFIPKNVKVRKGRQVIMLGIKVEVPLGYGMYIFSRSGAKAKGVEGYTILGEESTKQRFDCDVELGLVDCGYRGEIGLLINNHDREFWLTDHQSIAQAVFIKTESFQLIETDELTDSTRGEQGFNS